MYELWAVLRAFVSGSETNTLAQAFAGIMAFVIGWKFIIVVLETTPVLGGEGRGRVMVRGVLAIGLSILLGLTTAAAIGMLAYRP